VDKNKIWLIAAIGVMVAIGAGAWFLGVQPQMSASAQADAQRASVEATNQTYQAALTKLKADYSSLPKLKTDLAELSKSIPTGDAKPALLRELTALYPATGVTFVGYTMVDAEQYKPIVATPAAAETPAANGTGSGEAATPTPSATPSPAATASAAGTPAVSSPLITQTNYAAIPVTVTVRGQYANVLDFVSGLQSGSRLFLVTGLSTTQTTAQGAVAGSVDAKVSGYVYAILEPTTPDTSTATSGQTPTQTSAEATAKK
jgi:Tfp pilus assembly protein PilO